MSSGKLLMSSSSVAFRRLQRCTFRERISTVRVAGLLELSLCSSPVGYVSYTGYLFRVGEVLQLPCLSSSCGPPWRV